MVVDRGVPTELRFLPVPELAGLARHEIENIQHELRAKEQLLPRAVANLELIDRLRNSPAVETFLKQAGITIEILDRGGFIDSQLSRLQVSGEGLALTFAVQPTNVFVSYRGDIDAGAMRAFSESEKWPETHFVYRLAKLKPEELIEKFRKAVSAPVKV